MQAFPYPGIAERLEAILKSGTEVAFVSGRPSAELIQLFPLAAGLEIWGMHGREHRAADGTRTVSELRPKQVDHLNLVQGALEREGWADLLERKAGSLALHWRAIEGESSPGRTADEAREAAEKAFAGCAGQDGFAVLPFDGGLELRTEDRTKGHAVGVLLAEASSAASAFLGDDFTDEDGFRVMRERGGLGLLVRSEPRASWAAYSLKPPGELLEFLDTWIRARVRARIQARVRSPARAGSETSARVL